MKKNISFLTYKNLQKWFLKYSWHLIIPLDWYLGAGFLSGNHMIWPFCLDHLILHLELRDVGDCLPHWVAQPRPFIRPPGALLLWISKKPFLTLDHPYYNLERVFEPGASSEHLLEFDASSNPLGHHGRSIYSIVQW